MKKNFTLLAIVLFNVVCFAQYGTAPQKISYQAIVRNNDNELVKNSPVSVKLSILKTSITGESEYEETHAAQTNENGLLNIQIGGGNATKGIFRNGIYWGEPHFLKTEIDPLGKNNYTITSTSELLSVPVSNYSHTSGSLHGFSWDFVGAYKVGINFSTPNEKVAGTSFITYLGIDKVMLTISYLNTDKGDPNMGQRKTFHYYGTVLGNKINLIYEQYDYLEAPTKDEQGNIEQDLVEIEPFTFLGTKIGNEIKFEAYDGEDRETELDFTLIKNE